MPAVTKFWASAIATILSCGGCGVSFVLEAPDAGDGIAPMSADRGLVEGIEGGAIDRKSPAVIVPEPDAGELVEAAADVGAFVPDAARDSPAALPEAGNHADAGGPIVPDAAREAAAPSLCCNVPPIVGLDGGAMLEPCVASSWSCPYAADPSGTAACSREVCSAGQYCVWRGSSGFFSGTVTPCP